jgi:WhiB family transcriptional regulator, redox-sensing transcriptional regulator
MAIPAPLPTIRGPRIIPRPGLTRPGPWAMRALCADADPDTWFPGDEDQDLAAAAIAICGRCPVRTDCLAHALAIRESHGIWGGQTSRQRRALLTHLETAA